MIAELSIGALKVFVRRCDSTVGLANCALFVMLKEQGA